MRPCEGWEDECGGRDKHKGDGEEKEWKCTTVHMKDMRVPLLIGYKVTHISVQ